MSWGCKNRFSWPWGISVPVTTTAEKTEKDPCRPLKNQDQSSNAPSLLVETRLDLNLSPTTSQPSFLSKPFTPLSLSSISVEWSDEGTHLIGTWWGVREIKYHHLGHLHHWGVLEVLIGWTEISSFYFNTYVFIVKVTICFWQVILIFHWWQWSEVPFQINLLK